MRSISRIAVILTLCGAVFWSAASAQTLSGGSLLFGAPQSPSSSSAGPLIHSSLGAGAPSDAVAVPPIGLSMRLTDIPARGQSVDVPILSYSFAPQAPGTAQAGRQFTVAMLENLASPRLFTASLDGTRLPELSVAIRSQNASQEYVRWTLRNAVVTSFTTVAERSSPIPVDALTLKFDAITIAVTPVLENGTSGDTVTSGWDVRRNQAL